jgi:hypothetical protein
MENEIGLAQNPFGQKPPQTSGPHCLAKFTRTLEVATGRLTKTWPTVHRQDGRICRLFVSSKAAHKGIFDDQTWPRQSSKSFLSCVISADVNFDNSINILGMVQPA